MDEADIIRQADAELARQALRLAVRALDAAAPWIPESQWDWHVGATNLVARAAEELRDAALDRIREEFDAIMAAEFPHRR